MAASLERIARTGTATGSSAPPSCNRLSIESVSREQLADDYCRVRGATEALAAGLSAEDQNLQSTPETSPVKWHRAHTSWFFESFVLADFDSGWKPVDERYNYLFNSYYNGIGAQFPRPRRGLISRPDVEAVTDYRRAVDAAMTALIADCPDSRWLDLARLVRLGLNHEQQHQELIVTDLKHCLSHNPLYPTWSSCPVPPGGDVSAVGWLAFDERIAEIGAADDGCYRFDNESPRHRQVVAPFELASRPVSCGEYLDFIADGGYDDPDLWLSDGWTWLQETGTRAPLYWQHDEDGRWSLYTPGGLRPVDPRESLVHVSFYEAFAFARWAGARLPTEAEWEVAALVVDDEPGPFAEQGRFHPGPADAGAAEGATCGLFGNVWEWTASSYAPYPGFRAAPGAVGEYNGKFMANQMVLRGGSCATPAGHIRPSYRNFFYPPDRWQFSGIRLARDA